MRFIRRAVKLKHSFWALLKSPSVQVPMSLQLIYSRGMKVMFQSALFLSLALAGCSDDSAAVDVSGGDADTVVELDGAEDTRPEIDQTESDATDLVHDDGVSPLVMMTLDEAMSAVDPFIGTGGLGFGYAALTPAAQAPFGLVKLGPDSTLSGTHLPFMHFSGYHYDDDAVRGFSHTHFIGTGVADYGNVRVLPLRDLDSGQPGSWWTAWDKESESASPGYYSVDLPDVDVIVQLAASTRAGIHSYEFVGDDPAHLTIDVTAAVSGGTVHASWLEMTNEGAQGWVTYGGSYTGRSQPFTVYFSATLEPNAESTTVWDSEGLYESASSAGGLVSGGVFSWETAPSEPVLLRVGISFVDVEQATANRLEEIDGRTLETVREDTEALWREKMGRVRIGGADESTARMFYTALYNTYRMPTQLDGVDGRYRGLDGAVHEGSGHAYYTDLSLWDTFRTLHPWLTLVDPEAQRDCLLSLVRMYEQGGKYPRWPAAISYTGGMIGTSADMLFAGSALKGIDGVDYEAALDGLLASQPQMRGGSEDYLELGYVADDHHGNSVSRTLEYAWADWSLANLAEFLERPEEDELRERGRSYRNLFHEESGFFRPRTADGEWNLSRPVTEVEMGSGSYTEGTAWHWRFYAFHEGADFASLLGGESGLEEALEMFFDQSALGGSGPIDTLLPDDFYWHGNEPTIHAAYLFHEAGRYDRLAYWVREIQTRIYGDGPDGLPGNDDGGTMSSWYLFSALGIFPVAGSDIYALGTPLVQIAEVDMGDDSTLTIEAPGASVENRYVRSVLLNGEPIESGYLRHSDLRDATLTFEMAESAE